jgi:hypothetical protein
MEQEIKNIFREIILDLYGFDMQDIEFESPPKKEL